MRRAELNGWWAVGVVILAPLQRLLFRVRVRGLEHVPLRGGAILAFNHVSALDGPCLAIEVAWRLRRETRFLVAAEFFRHPFFGWVLRRYEQIAIRRGARDTDALDEALGSIRAGALAAIAPEGRVNADGVAGLLPLRAGAARLALPTGAPVIPVGVWGTQARWPRTGLRYGRPWRPRLAIVFGDPILPPEDALADGAIEGFTARVRAGLERQVALARDLTGA